MIRGRLYGDHDPYEGVPSCEPFHPAGWGSREDVFGELIAAVSPRRIVEVGTWLGGSAVTMALAAPGAEVVCVDTFAGSVEHWLDPKLRAQLALVSGRPGLYPLFQMAVVSNGLASRVTPMPMPSVQASVLFRKWGELADLIYIDAGHDFQSASADIHAWWGIVRPGGVMFGHDYSENWPGVCRAVDAFFGDEKEVRAPFWIARKGAPL